jgi:hypothetical protein
LLGVYSIFLHHFEKNFNGVIAEIGGIPNVVQVQVIESEEIDFKNNHQIFLDGSNNSTASLLYLTANKSRNCSLLSLPPEEYFE